MILKEIYSFNGIVDYLLENKEILEEIGLNIVPHRTTLKRRMIKANKKLREIVQFLGQYYCAIMSDKILIASMDSTLLKSKGPLWHKKYRKQGIVPSKLRGVDRDSKWGYSKTKGWIQGYKGHFNVVFDKDLSLIPFPIDVSFTTANISDIKKSKTLCSKLANNVYIELGDKGYDDNELFVKLWESEKLLITPIKKNEKKTGIRQLRYFWYKIFKQSKICYSRNTTIEPFNGRIRECFNIDPFPVLGKVKAKFVLYSSTIVYQLIVLYNLKTHRKIGAVKRFLNNI